MLRVHRCLTPRAKLLVRQQCKRPKTRQVKASVEGSQPLSRSAALMDTDTLWTNVVAAYARAQDAGSVFKTPTKTQFMRDDDSGVVFVLRVSESLRKKAKKPQITSEEKAFVNPFLPYEEDLWVQHLSNTHTLLLNKFNLVDYHLLVVTREFEKQEEPLNIKDFEATMKVMEVVPFPFAETLPNEVPIAPALAAGFAAKDYSPQLLKTLPFKMFGAHLPKGCSPDNICEKLAQLEAMASKEISVSESFNVLLTGGWIVVIPRRREAEGPCSVNALGFAGTLFVRSQEEIEYIARVGPMAILAGVAFHTI